MTRRTGISIAIAVLFALVAVAAAARPAEPPAKAELTPAQRADLHAIAAKTWTFYSQVDIDPTTSLPRDNVSDVPGSPAGTYTSPTNIGMYLWSIVAARDLKLIDGREALERARDELAAIEGLRKWNGFLLSWYDTDNGAVLTGTDLGPDDSPTVS